MKNDIRGLVSLLALLTLASQACGSSGGGNTKNLPDTPGPSTSAPTARSSPGSAATAPVVHTSKPGTGSKQEAEAHDNAEGGSFQSKDVQSGDQFNIDRFERPFTSKEMAYLPFVDIVNMSMTSDETWLYIQIELVGLGKGEKSPKGNYGAELDLNGDGRAELLVLSRAPIGSDWSTDGVGVYFDENGDIGGAQLYPDDIYTGNGYETTLVESGVGDDPDLAWARFVSSSRPVVELAFQRYLLQDASKVMWDVLASANSVDPTRLYYNDTFTEARAGSPRKNSRFYPVNQLWGFDNTCRVPLGFEATGTEPMGCSVSEEQADVEFGPPVPPVCPPRHLCVNR